VNGMRKSSVFAEFRAWSPILAHGILAAFLNLSLEGALFAEELERRRAAAEERVIDGESIPVEGSPAAMIEDGAAGEGAIQGPSKPLAAGPPGAVNEPARAPVRLAQLPPVPAPPGGASDPASPRGPPTVGRGAILPPPGSAPTWHLLSIPDQPDTVDPATLLPAIAADFDLAWAYDACAGADPWRLYDPAAPAASDLTAIDHEIGFWLRATAPDTLTVPGTEPAETTIQICTGWNLIGYPLAQNRPVLAALSSILGKFQRVYGWNPADVTEPWKVFDVDLPAWANTLTGMERGRGYWVYATEDAALTFKNVGPPPEVDITSPADADSISTFTDVVGTVRSDLLASWELAWRLEGETGPFTVFASGNTPVIEDALGVFDPTLLLNGLYELQLSATDFQGQSAAVVIEVVVVGDLKIGHFRLPLLDLEVPVAAANIQVIRTYDSREKRNRDFGIGWTLGLTDFQVRENGAPGLGWQGVVMPGILPLYCIETTRSHIVAVTFPDGAVARFQPVLEPQCQPIIPPQVVTVSYRPIDGSVARLDVLDVKQDNILVVGSFPGPVELWGLDINVPHDPETYRLTAADTTEYVVDQRGGLQSIQDPNGNLLTVSPNGIRHEASGIGLTFVRDSQSRITEVVDTVGNQMRYEYDARGDLVRVTDQEDRITRFTYKGDHFLDTIINPDGTEIAAFQYDGDNRWTGTCDPDNRCTVITHDFAGDREILTDASGRSLSLSYDEFGNVTEVRDDLDNTTTYEYDDFSNLLKVTYPDGGVMEFTYDDKGNVLSQVTPHPPDQPAADFTTTFAHDSKGNITRVSYPTGAAYVMTYDGAGNLLTQEDEAGHLLLARTYGPGGIVTSETTPFGTTTFGDHDAQGNPGTETDAFGVTTSYSYNGAGKLLTMRDPAFDVDFAYDNLGRLTGYDFDDGTALDYQYGLGEVPTVMEGATLGRQERLITSTGRLRGWVMPDGGTSTFSQDPSGRLTAMTDARNQPTTLAYDDAGRLATRTDARQATFTFERDSIGRVTAETDPLDHTSRMGYDLAGRLTSRTDARNHTWAFDHRLSEIDITDPLNRKTTVRFSPHRLPVEVTLPDGATIEREYLLSSLVDDAQSFPTRIQDEGGKVRTFTYDDHGLLLSATDLAGQPTTYTHEGRRRSLLSMTGPTGRSRSFTYDGSGRLQTLTYPEGDTETYSYGGDYTLDRKTRASGTTIDFTYDAGFRVATRTSSLGESHGFVWNPGGSLHQATDAIGTTLYDYDASTALRRVDYPGGGSITYERDLLGRIEAIEVESAPAAPSYRTEYGYDEVGNLTSILDPLGGLTTLAYDAVNRLTTRTLPNGVVTSYGYDARDQLISIVHRDGSGNILTSIDYEREGVGEPRKITREDGSFVDLGYDPGRRIATEAWHDGAGTLVESLGYTYDLAGNRQSSTTGAGTDTWTYGAGHQLTAISGPGGAESYAYDSDGRLAERSRDGQTLHFAYSSRDELLAVTDGAGQTLASFTYDALGRRVAAQDGSVGRRMLVAPGPAENLEHTHLITDPTGALLAGFVYAGNLPLMRFGPAGPVYYLEDAMGSVIGLADENGAAVARFVYDGFGNLREETGPAAAPDPALGGDFRFQGGWLDATTDLYHFRARYYDPETGRFLSRDALNPSTTLPETLNSYAFAFSNPHLFRDPTGLFSMMEINITMSVSDIINMIKTSAVNYARQTAKEKIGNAIGELLSDFLGSILPFYAESLGIIPLLLGATFSQQGNIFERLIGTFMCDIMEKMYPAALRTLYIEVSVSQYTGEALNNGLFRCVDGSLGGTGSGPAIDPLKIGKGGLPGQAKRPDLIFSAVDPVAASRYFGGNKTFIIGDFKRSGDAIGSNRGQFEAMVLHARHYGYHLAIFITIGRPSKDKGYWVAKNWAFAQQFALQNFVKVFVVSLF